MRLDEIFTPTDTPTHTYVKREDLKLESTLKARIELPKSIVSISGPSKSGKTVLVDKVLRSENVIKISGSEIKNANDIWHQTMAWMDAPSSITTTSSKLKGRGGGVGVAGKAGLDSVSSVSGNLSLNLNSSNSETTSKTYLNTGMNNVVRKIANSEYVLFIDDFHYIDKNLQNEIGRQIKVAAERGIKILVATVPHRADDAVRSNPELAGRVAAVNFDFWSKEHLRQIADLGFDKLRIKIADEVIERIVDEAMGSPQLMQSICFCLCEQLGVFHPRSIISLKSEQVAVDTNTLKSALLKTSEMTDLSHAIKLLHTGPKSKGQDRKVHAFKDGSKGDVYRALLLAIKSDPISLSFSYDEIMRRLKDVCADADTPTGSSVNSCLDKMNKISESQRPGRPVLAWDEKTLDIVDPYFAFFLRCSDITERLKNA